MRVLASLLLLLVSAPVIAETVTFKFAPPLDEPFQRTMTTKTRRTLNGIRTEEVSTLIAKVKYSAKGNDFEVRDKTESVTYMLEGKESGHPFISTMIGVELQYRIGRDGTMKSVRGYDGYLRNFFAFHAEEQHEALRGLITEEMLEKRDIAEWGSRIGDFAGVTVNIGDEFEGEGSHDTPTGKLKFKTFTRIDSIVPCGRTKCVRITFRYESDPEALRKMLGGVANEMTKRDGREAGKTEAGATRLTGDGERFIDPETMMIHYEHAVRKISGSLVVQDVKVDFQQEELRSYEFDYSHEEETAGR